MKWLENQLHLIKSPKEGTFSMRIIKFKWGVSCHVNLNGTLWRKVSSASFSFILHYSDDSASESSSSPTYKIFEISLVVIWWNDFNFDWWLWYSQEDSSSTLNISSRVKPQQKIPRDLLTDRKASWLLCLLANRCQTKYWFLKETSMNVETTIVRRKMTEQWQKKVIVLLMR